MNDIVRVPNLSWLSIVRLGLVQTALGAIVVLTTSTLNRVMVVELALAAMLPGALVTAHHAMQMFRPRMGYGSDVGQRRTPWIIGGMAALALGGAGAAFATSVMAYNLPLGIALGLVAYATIGGGVSACGTSLLVLMAKRVAPERRPAAATDRVDHDDRGLCDHRHRGRQAARSRSRTARLIAVTGGVSPRRLHVVDHPRHVACSRVTEENVASSGGDGPSAAGFMATLKEVWAEHDARLFTIFVFVSMVAYSAQDLILEPFAGSVFGFTPGESTSLAGQQHAGAFLGMVLVAVITSVFKRTRLASLKGWVIGGCLASAVALGGLAIAGLLEITTWPLKQNVFLMGLANGAFSIAAIATMMAMASRGGGAREGTRMGLWGAAQSVAFAGGGFVGTVLADGARALVGSSSIAYAFVFAFEAIAFVAAIGIALRIAFDVRGTAADRADPTPIVLQPAAVAAHGST
jgi:BCD family chlorophyll transporter-like MFS transporter